MGCCCLRKLVSFPATVAAAAASPVTRETLGVFLKFGALCWDELSRSGNKRSEVSERERISCNDTSMY